MTKTAGGLRISNKQICPLQTKFYYLVRHFCGFVLPRIFFNIFCEWSSVAIATKYSIKKSLLKRIEMDFKNYYMKNIGFLFQCYMSCCYHDVLQDSYEEPDISRKIKRMNTIFTVHKIFSNNTTLMQWDTFTAISISIISSTSEKGLQK